MAGYESPPWTATFAEVRAWGEYAGLVATRPLLDRGPRGDGHSVIVYPGLLAGDTSTGPLRRYLRRLGYRARGWSLGVNTGPDPSVIATMERELADEAHRRGPVSLIGWSLGGIYARHIARRHPARVRQVITLASPFRMGADDTSRATGTYRWLLEEKGLDRFSMGPSGPVGVPATSIFTRSDGIVDWRACIEYPAATTESIEVASSHFGIGHHPVALWVIADRLAQPAGGWRPLEPPPLLRPLVRRFG